MQVEVRCYGRLRRPPETVELPPDSRVADLLARMGLEVGPEVAVFVDGQQASAETILTDGANTRIVMLAPPLTGG